MQASSPCRYRCCGHFNLICRAEGSNGPKGALKDGSPPKSLASRDTKPTGGGKGGGKPSGNDDSGDPQPPSPPPLSPSLRRFVALLVEFGGVYGTIAVAVAAATGIDAFGNFHWDADHAQLGLALFTPIMLLDAAMLLPDYATTGAGADKASRLNGPGDAAAAGSAPGAADDTAPPGATTVRLFTAKQELEEAQKVADSAADAGSSSSGRGTGTSFGASLQLALEALQVRSAPIAATIAAYLLNFGLKSRLPMIKSNSP